MIIERPTLVFNTRDMVRMKPNRGRGGRANALRNLLGGGDGVFIDFTDQSIRIADTTTAANNFNGRAFDKLSFTRASTATQINADGLIETAASGAYRVEYDPSTRATRGILVEESRTNLLLNSATLSTQSVTVTAAAHTLSFYGTGSVTLSGAATATVNGTGAYPTQTKSTFTPTAGTLTLTVSGSVTFAQLELGVIASSYIPTTGSTATRAAEVCKILTSVFPASATGIMPTTNAVDVSRVIASLSTNSFNESRYISRSPAGSVAPTNVTGGSGNVSVTGASPGALAAVKIAARYQVNNSNIAVNGSVPGADDTVCAEPLAPTQLNIGNLTDSATNQWHGWIQQIAVIPIALTNAQLASVTA